MTTKYFHPTLISLSEIKPEGQEFPFSETTGELTPHLKDLIDDHPYKATLFLKPLGNVFEISGEISTKMDLPCAKCGRDLEYPIEDHFHELILVEKDRPRNSSGSHAAHEVDASGPFCNHVQSDRFNLAEFVHEHIAASEPYVAHCGRPDCEMHMQALQDEIPQIDTEKGTNPFAILKNFKPTH